MEAVPVIAWFRSKQQLLARNTELEALVAKQTDEIAQLRDDNDSIWLDVQRQAAQQAQVLDHTRKLLDAHEAKNAQLVEELRSLRDDIARREQAETEALTYMPVRGFGMARDIAPAKRRTEPMPWQTPDAIAQETQAKRNEDI